METCAACHCNLPDGHYLQDDDCYCDRCWSCPDCARPVPGGGRCAACQTPGVEVSRVLPGVLGFLQTLGIEMTRTPPVGLRPGRPAAVCAGLLAHELTYAWQAEHCPQQSSQLREGLARWVQRRMLLQLGQTRLARRLVLDDIRSGSLRRCLRLEARVGERRLLDLIRELPDFPLCFKLSLRRR